MGFDFGAFNEEFYKKKGYARGPPDKTIKELAEILSATAPQGHVLDLGAGDGRHALYMAKEGFRVTAVEKCQAALERLEILVKTNSRIQPVQGDITVIEGLPQNHFDAVICTYVVHELQPEQARRITEYVRDHVKPAGYFALSAWLGKFRTHFEQAREQFMEWKEIKSIPGKSYAKKRKRYDKIELLLQKPNGV